MRTRAATLVLAAAAALALASGASAGVLNAPPAFTVQSGCGGAAAYPAIGGATSVAIQAADSDFGQSVSIEVSGLPAWLSATTENGNPATATVTGDPGLLQFVEQFIAGPPAPFTVTATDSIGAQATCALTPVVTLLGFA